MASRGRGGLDRDERLELDIDLRMHSVVLEALGRDGWDREAVARLLRLAYGSGYTDALSEPVRGQLCLDHGLAVPPAPRAT